MLPPRLHQTLHLLLAGDSEKQIALRLGLSRNTVHHYVKDLYKRFGVSSRAELMARWVRQEEAWQLTPRAGLPMSPPAGDKRAQQRVSARRESPSRAPALRR